MMRGGKKLTIAGGASISIAIAIAWTVPLRAQTFYPPHAVVDGKTIAEWTIDWWTWALSTPNPRNPIIDPTGQFTPPGQAGPVFFLTGNGTSRACSVPRGRSILFPFVNVIAGNGPGEQDSCKFWLEAVAEYIDATCEMSCKLDGAPIEENFFDYRETSRCFDVKVPVTDNWMNRESFCLWNAVSDGYWLMLKPLPDGVHTLHWKAKVCGSQVQIQELTCELTVGDVPVPPGFTRGDANGDGSALLSDAISILVYLFLGGIDLDCQDAADVDDDGDLFLADAVNLLNYLFLGGCRPPWPTPGMCGADSNPEEPDLGCSRSCAPHQG